jgi:hypothetical protein
MPRMNMSVCKEKLLEHHAALAAFSEQHKVPIDHFVKRSLEVHPVVMSATRKVVILAQPMRQFMEALTDCYSPDRHYYGRNRLKMTCPIIWNKNRDMAIVFPNLPLDSLTYHGVNSVSSENPWFPHHTSTVANNIMCDLEHPEKSKAWYPMSRGIKRLGKRQVMPLSRAIARYVTHDDEPIKDAQRIDDMAQRMLELNMPTEMHYARTVDEIRAMYVRQHSETPNSCMDSMHSFHLSNPVRPVDFYGHCPVTMGVYLARGGTVMARTICWLDAPNDQWYYSRVYAVRSHHREDLVKQMEATGIRDMSKRTVVIEAEFTIPANDYRGHVACPMPYFDSQPFGVLALKHNKSEDAFDVVLAKSSKHVKPGWSYPSLTMTSGSHMQSMSTECDSCGSNIDVDDDCFINISGNSFCCDGCALEADGVQYVTGNGVEWMYEHNLPDGWLEGLRNDYVFSNEEAARRRGYLYHVLPWAGTEDPIYFWPSEDGETYAAYRVMYPYSEKDTRAATVYLDSRISRRISQDCGNWQPTNDDGKLAYLEMPASIAFDYPHMSNIDAPANRVRTLEGVPTFTDDIFDKEIDGILNPPAELCEGVLCVDEAYRLFHSGQVRREIEMAIEHRRNQAND